MAGRVLVEIERDGEVVPVTEVGENGVVLHGETSASPRGLGIDIRPLSAGTKVKFKQVQQRHGWVNPVSFKLNLSRRDSKLAVEGVDEDSLPEGKYELKIRIGGMKVKPTFPQVKIPKDGDVKLRLKEKAHRRLVLNRPVEEFDENTRNILIHRKSVLDGMKAGEWLTGAKHRDHRKAVLLNVLSKLAAIPTARPAESLSRQVEHVFFVEIDRIYCAVSGDFHKLVKAAFTKDSVIDATHRRLLGRIPGCPDDFDLVSYREPTRRGSLQTVVAVPKSGPAAPHYVDMDIDGANPGQDLVTFFIHVGEILDPDATNHLRLVKRLDRAQVGDFLYYDVEKA
jgi:hypothetical protein